MKFKAVIFDLFGTLVDGFDYKKYREETLGGMAKILGLTVDDFEKEWKATVGQRFTGVYPSVEANIADVGKNLARTWDSETIRKAAQIRFAFAHKSLVPRVGTLEVLEGIARRGLKLGLMSDCSLEVPQLWQDCPLSKCLEVTGFSCVEGVRKPDPTFYQSVTKRLGVEPVHCLYVGDGGGNELSGARAQGMTPVLIEPDPATLSSGYGWEASTWKGPRIRNIREVWKFLE